MLPPDEFGLIRDWTGNRHSASFLAQAGVVLGVGDDAAIVAGLQSNEDWLYAVDTMVETVHFRSETMNDGDVGFKALAANVSDIAAMGGVPKFALVSVSVPPAWNANRMRSLYDGLYECANRYGIAIIGGDTTSAPEHLVVSVTIIGSVEAGRGICRSGAAAGQSVFLTGPTGLSAGGLHALLANRSADPYPGKLVQAHQRPNPSVKAGRILLGQSWATSLNDVSDGLSSEAWEIAEASDVAIVLEEAGLPISGELASYAKSQGIDPLEWILRGGEDYVLLGTANKDDEPAMKRYFREAGIPLFFIGAVEDGPPDVRIHTHAGRAKPLPKGGYNHFAKG